MDILDIYRRNYSNKRTICDVYGTYFKCQQKKLVKGKTLTIFLFLRFVSRLQGWNMLLALCLLMEVLSSDNSIVCFRQKAFLKSDMLAGFTTRVALIWYLACVISRKFDFYSNFFEFGALHFHWLLARLDASVRISKKRLSLLRVVRCLRISPWNWLPAPCSRSHSSQAGPPGPAGQSVTQPQRGVERQTAGHLQSPLKKDRSKNISSAIQRCAEQLKSSSCIKNKYCTCHWDSEWCYAALQAQICLYLIG